MLGLSGLNDLTRFNLPISDMHDSLTITSIQARHYLFCLHLFYILTDKREMFLDLIGDIDGGAVSAISPDMDFLLDDVTNKGVYVSTPPPEGYINEPHKWFKALIPKTLLIPPGERIPSTDLKDFTFDDAMRLRDPKAAGNEQQ